ncbi:MAG: formylglycine-generating enzyme family protein [Bacteroidales bacterium]|nr:formylglycine-generating enzyme family protein [Bacteroidales bacterium]
MKQLAIIFLTLILCVPTFAQKNKVVTIEINDKMKIDMVYIPADTFVRKNFYGDTCRPLGCYLKPVVAKGAYNGTDTIVLSDYYIAKFEVTQLLYETVMHKNPSWYNKTNTPELKNNDFDYRVHPAERVSWYEAQEFVDSLSALTGRHFRLPTEAEWEYAARAKHYNDHFSGSDDFNEVAWAWDNGGQQTHPVGKLRPNTFGLYDMSGNVEEWCSDWFSPYYYEPDTLYVNPTGPPEGHLKVIRGGSWGVYPNRACELDTRRGEIPTKKTNQGSGIRLVMDAEPVKH